MPVSPAAISIAGKSSLDHFLRNPPVDQVDTARPFMDKLRAGKKLFGGGKEFVVAQLHKDHGETAEWYYSDQEMAFSDRDTLEQARFAWRSVRDGYMVTDDALIRNGLTPTDDLSARMNASEVETLTNLLVEKNYSLRKGFNEALDRDFHRSGSASMDAIKGLDHLISTTPNTGTRGDLNSATYEWWRSNTTTGMTTSGLVQSMEQAWRACSRNGGRPDAIFAGSDVIDAYRAATFGTGGAISREVSLAPQGQAPLGDAGTGRGGPGGTMSGLFFHGVELVWDPVLADLQALDGGTPSWEKRIYFLNCAYMAERPVKNYDEMTFQPPVVYSRPEVRYMGVRWKGAYTVERLNCHWVGSLS